MSLPASAAGQLVGWYRPLVHNVLQHVLWRRLCSEEPAVHVHGHVRRQDGAVYNQTAVFGQSAILNTEALEIYGLPRLTASNVWANMAAMATCHWSFDHPYRSFPRIL